MKSDESNKASQDVGDDLMQQARDAVKAILGRAIPIRARTLAEAIAEAERLKATENILVAQNGLWEWFNALPTKEKDAIGQFENKYRLWTAARLRNRLQ